MMAEPPPTWRAAGLSSGDLELRHVDVACRAAGLDTVAVSGLAVPHQVRELAATLAKTIAATIRA
jgi:hypothetical protein